MQRKSFDLVVAHGVVLEWKPAVGEHKLRVIFLRPLDPPWRVNNHHIKFSNFFYEQIPVEVTHVAVHKGFSVGLTPQLLHSIDHSHCVQEFVSILAVVGVDEWEFELLLVFWVLVGDFVGGFGYLFGRDCGELLEEGGRALEWGSLIFFGYDFGLLNWWFFVFWFFTILEFLFFHFF